MNLNKLSLIICLLSISSFSDAQSQQCNLAVVFGDEHMYTVRTPENWINDQLYAQKVNLTNFFYCCEDKKNSTRSYIFTTGMDKNNESENLETYIEHEIRNYELKHQEVRYDRYEARFSPPLINGVKLSFFNLQDRYAEEVLYYETEESIIVMTFATFSKEDYHLYYEVFNTEFARSFHYRGNQPKLFIEWRKIKP